MSVVKPTTKFETSKVSILNEIDLDGEITCLEFDNSTQCNNILKRANVNAYTLKILNLNIRSIFCNLDKLLVFLELRGLDVDIIVLTECHTNNEYSPDPPCINNYNMHFSKCRLNKNDGVVVYLKDSIEATVEEPAFKEGNCLVIRLGKEYSIVCSYRPPCYKNTSTYLESLNDILLTLHTNNIILTGDININTLPVNNEKKAEDYHNLIASHGLRKCIDKPTRPESQTCLDHFMVKTKNNASTIIFEPITDHCPILLTMEKSSINKRTTTYEKVTMNIEEMRVTLSAESWHDFYNSNSVNTATEKLVSKLNYTKKVIQPSPKYLKGNYP